MTVREIFLLSNVHEINIQFECINFSMLLNNTSDQ